MLIWFQVIVSVRIASVPLDGWVTGGGGVSRVGTGESGEWRGTVGEVGVGGGGGALAGGHRKASVVEGELRPCQASLGTLSPDSARVVNPSPTFISNLLRGFT